MAQSDDVIDHSNHPRNAGGLPQDNPNVDPGLVGAPHCGDVIELRIRVQPGGASHRRNGVQDVRLWLGNCRLFASHRVGQGQDVEEPLAIKNTNIVREFSLPPVQSCPMAQDTPEPGTCT